MAPFRHKNQKNCGTEKAPSRVRSAIERRNPPAWWKTLRVRVQRVFDCATDLQTKKAIERQKPPPAAEPIPFRLKKQKPQNGDSPRPNVLQSEQNPLMQKNKNCGTEKAPSRVHSAAERRNPPARWNTLRVRRDERHFVSAGVDKQQIIDQTKHDLHEGRSRRREPDLEQRNACHPADRIGDRNPHAE